MKDMKNYKRAERRERSRNAVKRRIKNYLFFNVHVIENNRMTGEYLTSNVEKEEFVMKGRGFGFLRTTGCPCNCYSCSGANKYRRTRAKAKQKVLKDIKEQMRE